MTRRGLLAAFCILALGVRLLLAGEPAKAPAGKAPPAKTQAPEAKAPEDPRARLAKLYEQAEALFGDGRYREAQRLYAQIALERAGYRSVARRLHTIRERLAEAERRTRRRQIDQHVKTARARLEAADYEAAAQACEAALAIEPANRAAQRLLAEATRELELRRRITAMLAGPRPSPHGREVIAQAQTAVTPSRGASPEAARPPGAAPAVRPDRPGAPPKGRRIVGPNENIQIVEAPRQPAARPGRPQDQAEGHQLVEKAWDTYRAALAADNPRAQLRKALDILAPITPISPHSQRTKDTAALLRASIARRLGSLQEGRGVSPEAARRARHYRRYAEAQELFRKKEFDEAIRIAEEILAEDPRFTRARDLRHQARSRKHEILLAQRGEDNAFVVEEELGKVDDVGTPPQEPAPVPRPTIDLTRPTYEVASPELEETLNQRVSVNLIDIELDYLLDLLFRSTGVSVIYNPEVVADKTITVHVSNYPLRQLLDYIARNHGLMIATTRDGVLLTTTDEPRLETFVLPLHHGIVDVEIAPPSAAVSKAGAGAEPMEPYTSSNLEKLVEQFPQLIEWPTGSFTYLDRQMNILYLRTTRDSYREALRLVEYVDRMPVQVLIKALFIEVDATDFEAFGIEGTLSKRLRLGSPGSGWWRSMDFDIQPGNILKFPGEAVPGVTAPDAGLEFTLAGVLDETQFEITLDALQRSARSRTLAAPNVICLNNCTARISVTKELVYVEDYEVDRSDISGTTYGYPYAYQQQQQQQQQYPYYPLSSEPIIIPVFAEGEDTGFTLDVTCSVGKDTRFIVMTLNPRIREEIPPRLTYEVVFPVTRYQTTTNGEPAEPQKATVERPIIGERSLSTKLTVADGAIVALGGLIQQKKIRIRSKVPILSDIPIIGQFIGRSTFRDQRTNLLIFVQAEVITPTGARYTDSGRVGQSPEPTRRVVVGETRPPTVRPAIVP